MNTTPTQSGRGPMAMRLAMCVAAALAGATIVGADEPDEQYFSSGSFHVSESETADWNHPVAEDAGIPQPIEQGEATDSVMPLPITSDNCAAACPGECHGVNKDPGHPMKPHHKKPGDINEGNCPSKRYRMSDCVRSGHPRSLYSWATPSINADYSAWYVGGGAAFFGRGRCSDEGTWGLDYDGIHGHIKNFLNYTGGRRQGGEGAYETDHVPLRHKLSSAHE